VAKLGTYEKNSCLLPSAICVIYYVNGILLREAMFCKIRKWQQLSLCLACGMAAFANCASSSAAAADNEEADKRFLAGMRSIHRNNKKSDIVAVRHFVIAAELGHLGAIFNLGQCFESGRGVTKNLQTAADYRRLVADHGSVLGQSTYARYLEVGTGVPVNKALARYYFEQAVAQEDAQENAQAKAQARYRYGISLHNNWGCYRNIEMGANYFKLAAEQKNNRGACDYGEHLLFDSEVITNPAVAVRYFRQAADEQDSEGLCWLGRCLLYGIGIPQDIRNGIDCIKLAADHGCNIAQHEYLLCLANNIGTASDSIQEAHYRKLIENGVAYAPPIYDKIRYKELAGLVTKIDTDPVVAASKLKQLADTGDADAQYTYGWCIIEGIGVCADPTEAMAYFRLAADQGNAEGQYGLGWYLINGVILKQDPAAAADCFKAAAAQKNADALYCLGWCFEAGVGVPQDRAEAMRLWELAAAHGNTDAQYQLGLFLLKGIGVEHNPDEAVRYLKMAAAQGHIYAQYTLLLCYSTGTGCEQNLAEADVISQRIIQRSAYP
jgi:TPR repeat protein